MINHFTCTYCEGHRAINYYNYVEGGMDDYTCPSCDGQGVILWMMPFSYCGNKKAEEYKKKFLLPAGIDIL